MIAEEYIKHLEELLAEACRWISTTQYRVSDEEHRRFAAAQLETQQELRKAYAGH